MSVYDGEFAITLRDLIAAAVLSGLIGKYEARRRVHVMKSALAEEAYALADAMIVARATKRRP